LHPLKLQIVFFAETDCKNQTLAPGDSSKGELP
jgi:hypothetical protein